MNKNKHNISVLKNIIKEELTKEISESYAIFDLPYHTNIGDSLIWEGEVQFLNDIQSKCVYHCSYFTCSFPTLKENVTILFHGGGNFGDLYPEHIDFLKKIIKKYHNNKIIVFPQTIHYKDIANLRKDINDLSTHKYLLICTRDSYSFNLINNNSKLKVKLIPDMAFYINYNSLPITQSDKKLFILRKDNEVKKENNTFVYSNDIDVKDWPTFNKKVFDGTFTFKVLSKLTKFNIPFMKDILNWYALYFFRSRLNHIGYNFLSNYNEIYTTRLHGCILSILMNKKVTLLDNNYGKNSNFYNTWLKTFIDVDLK